MDDSKKELAVAVVRGMSLRDTEESTVLNEDKALKRWVRRLERESWRRRDTDVLRGGSERLCTEAVLRKKLDHAKRIIRVQKKPSEVQRRVSSRLNSRRPRWRRRERSEGSAGGWSDGVGATGVLGVGFPRSSGRWRSGWRGWGEGKMLTRLNQTFTMEK